MNQTQRIGKRGFPLFWVMCFMGIIGLMAAIAIPQFSAYRQRSYSPFKIGAQKYTLASPQKVILSESPSFRGSPDFNTEEYGRIYENRFMDASQNPLSTFSIDVDTASYSNVRRFIRSNQMPPKDAVRIEEMINYFDYNYPQPHGEQSFSIITEISQCPWNPQNRLIHIGLQGKSLDYNHLKPSNLVFLIDSSGSMTPKSDPPPAGAGGILT